MSHAAMGFLAVTIQLPSTQLRAWPNAADPCSLASLLLNVLGKCSSECRVRGPNCRASDKKLPIRHQATAAPYGLLGSSGSAAARLEVLEEAFLDDGRTAAHERTEGRKKPADKRFDTQVAVSVLPWSRVRLSAPPPTGV
ncbi:uncharacterized protein EI97DRAFT_271342 [Westerdykella ornata]|uniref:Uncharacterized protein n=1 Tax=Westerdykella ornata TaxID=318751 RepID=A0A6A6JPW3_WESOR|nr:uncharacterized protein EI97DRAFT_271342 [Westerdykella ornata]KAF2277716.1 hypothetical protein EI97DRAFT_271342 [Westerdykella ornata]